MKLKAVLITSIVSFATAAFAAPASPSVSCTCAPGTPTAASYTWDFKGEANNLFADIQADAQAAATHASYLQTYSENEDLDWEAHAVQLDPLKREINDMGQKLCRLQAIRRATAPWQQAEIDRITPILHLMGNNTQQAILFGNAHTRALWLPQYRNYTDNLYKESEELTRDVDSAVQYAKVNKEYRDLRHEMGRAS